MTPDSLPSKSTYCVRCQTMHSPPVAVAINDRCPKYEPAKGGR